MVALFSRRRPAYDAAVMVQNISPLPSVDSLLRAAETECPAEPLRPDGGYRRAARYSGVHGVPTACSADPQRTSSMRPRIIWPPASPVRSGRCST